MEHLETNGLSRFSGQASQNSGAESTASNAQRDEDFEGRELRRYADDNKMTTEQIWGKIKRGELVARCHQGRMYVLENLDQLDELLRKTDQESPAIPIERLFGADHVEVVPPSQEEIEGMADSEEDVFSAFATDANEEENHGGGYLTARPLHHPPEIALLLDHLSLAKEENKDILKLTQNAIAQITSMTQSMLSLKDELLTTKEDQLNLYKGQLVDKDRELNQLKQEVEDLKMLASALTVET